MSGAKIVGVLQGHTNARMQDLVRAFRKSGRLVIDGEATVLDELTIPEPPARFRPYMAWNRDEHTWTGGAA